MIVSRFSIYLLSVALFSTFAFPLAAETGTTKEDLLGMDRSEVLQAAREAFEAENFETAIQGLILANRARHDARILGNIARSLEESGDCHQAVYYYKAALRDESLAESARQSLRESMDSTMAGCQEYRPDGTGRLIVESEPLLSTIYLNGEVLGTTPFEVAGLEVGTYEIRIEQEGFLPFEETLELEADDDFQVEAILEVLPEAPAEEAPVAVAQEPKGPNYIAYGLLGAGALSLGAGAFVDLSRIPAIDEEREAANQALDNDRVDELTAERLRMANLALGGYIVGGLLVVGGASWLIYDHFIAPDSQDRENWAFAPTFQSEYLGLQLRRRF